MPIVVNSTQANPFPITLTVPPGEAISQLLTQAHIWVLTNAFEEIIITKYINLHKIITVHVRKVDGKIKETWDFEDRKVYIPTVQGVEEDGSINATS